MPVHDGGSRKPRDSPAELFDILEQLCVPTKYLLCDLSRSNGIYLTPNRDIHTTTSCAPWPPSIVSPLFTYQGVYIEC